MDASRQTLAFQNYDYAYLSTATGNMSMSGGGDKYNLLSTFGNSIIPMIPVIFCQDHCAMTVLPNSVPTTGMPYSPPCPPVGASAMRSL